MRRKDNRGASFVMVIIAMAIVAILAVTVLWLALANMQMKVTNKKNTDNFYSAEGVLDQICTGLQSDVSNAYKIGYTNVMQNYKLSTSETERQNEFQLSFVGSLRSSLKGSKELTYDIGKIRGYVDDSLTAENSKPHADITTTSLNDGSNDGQLVVNANGVVLKKIHVKYTDEKGYESVIETDISLTVPSMKFSASGAVPELFAYSIIGNSGVTIAGDHATNTLLNGNLYAGNPYLVTGSGDDITSLTVPNGKKLEVDESSFFITNGDFNIGDVSANTSSGSTFKSSAQCQVWADNVYVKGATAEISGNTFVKDDLTLKCVGSNVKLGSDKTQKYVGFSDGNTDAKDSSAILVNGKNSSLDMSNLDTLMVSGYAYISTNDNNKGYSGSWAGKKNEDVKTGESISIKGNQIAYLIPAECIVTDGDGADAKSLYTKNPITYKEYKKSVEVKEGSNDSNEKKYTEINTNIVSQKLGKPLSYYFGNNSPESCIRRVFVQSTTPNSDDGLVYYYVNLPEDKAAEYYTDYFNADKIGENKLLNYTKFYTQSIKVNKDSAASIFTSGNYSIYDNNELKLVQGNKSGMSSSIGSVAKTYDALNMKLVTDKDSLNGVTVSPGTKTLFSNLISSESMNKFLGVNDKVTITTTVNSKEYNAIITKKDYKFDSSDKDKNVSLIVSEGNVDISADFTGTIIAKGKVNIKKDADKIGNSTQEIFRALLMEQNGTEEDAMHLYDIFTDGKALLGDAAKDVDDLDYTNLITYQNWNKQ